MLVEEVGAPLPGAKLAAVARDGSSGVIYGVAYRRKASRYGSAHVKGWLLRLSETEDGQFYWDDLLPECQRCNEVLSVSEWDWASCPACYGEAGSGQCAPLECGWCGYGENQKTYCGSHPFFSHNFPEAEVAGNSGPPLWEDEIDSWDEYTLEMLVGGSHICLLPGDSEEPEFGRHLVLGNTPEVVTEYDMDEPPRPCISATVLSTCNWRRLQRMFSLVHHFPGELWIWKWVLSPDGQCRVEKEEVQRPEGFQLGEQMMVVRDGCLIGLSKGSLWAMDWPSDQCEKDTSATDFASQVSWRKLLDLPEDGKDANEAEEYGSRTWDEFPRRLLAAGPKENQVIIFKTDGIHVKPWLLAELCGDPWGATTNVTKITSTASVLCKKEEGQRFCWLLPSVFRMNKRHGGYLFFDERGRLQHLRDEEILLQQDAWVAPIFATDSTQRMVTFKFPAEGDVGRACLSSVLMSYEYFRKALEGWQEGSSSEVVVKDATTQTFDSLLAYFHTGTVGDCGLESLLGLLELGNKYLLAHLMALCMSKILRRLAESGFIRSQSATVIADLLIFAAEASACSPFKAKLIDAISHARSDLTEDPAFLSRLSVRSVTLLAELLSYIRRKQDSPELSERRFKRRKVRITPPWADGSESEQVELPLWSKNDA